MEIFTHEYKLKCMGSWNEGYKTHKAEGALLKFIWNDGRVGYADLHPWPSLGDEDLKGQLKKLAKGKLTAQIEQSLWFAARDADFRAQKKNAFEKGVQIRNHFLLMDGFKTPRQSLLDAKELGFQTLKLKVGRDPVPEMRWINEELSSLPFKLRMDFNSQLNFSSVVAFFNGLNPAIKNKIEFFEDPCPFKKDSWLELNKHVSLAIDRELRAVDTSDNELPFQYLVYKPAIQEFKEQVSLALDKKLKLVVTSNLDHPVGVAHAAWVAADIKKKHPHLLADCGLLSMGAYKYDDFTSMLKADGSYFTGTFGEGVGFDFLLEKLVWQPIS